MVLFILEGWNLIYLGLARLPLHFLQILFRKAKRFRQAEKQS